MELLRLKRMLSKYLYYRDEFNETEYLFKEYSTKFNTSFLPIQKPETKPKTDESISETTESISETIPETEIKSDLINKMYRKLSLITHPDKKGGSVEIFNQVHSEYSKGNTIGLLLLAQEHNLDIKDILDYSKNYSETEFENDLKILADSSARIKSSLAWVWQSADSVKREELRQRFNF